MADTPLGVIPVVFDEWVEREESSVRRVSRDQWDVVKRNILSHLVELGYKKPRFKYDKIVCNREGYAFDFMGFVVLGLFTYVFWHSYKIFTSSPFSLFDWVLPLLVSATAVFIWCSLSPITLDWIEWERSYNFVHLRIYGQRKDRLSFIDNIGLKPKNSSRSIR